MALNHCIHNNISVMDYFINPIMHHSNATGLPKLRLFKHKYQSDNIMQTINGAQISELKWEHIDINQRIIMILIKCTFIMSRNISIIFEIDTKINTKYSHANKYTSKCIKKIQYGLCCK